jgi:hypothetical protein
MADRLTELDVRKALLVSEINRLDDEARAAYTAERNHVDTLEEGSSGHTSHTIQAWELYGISTGLRRALAQIERLL